MKRNAVTSVLLIAIGLLGIQTLSAQFSINVPKIFKTKTTSSQPSSEPSASTARTTAADRRQASMAPKNDCHASFVIDVFIDDINQARQSVEAFQPGSRSALVPDSDDNYLLVSLSPKARDQWFKTKNMLDYRNNKECNKVDPALDLLAASAKAKLSSFQPDASLFHFRDPAAEQLLMNGFKNPSNIKVFKTGLASAGWTIEKNDIGLPKYRWRYASVWVRDTSEDQPFCHVYGATIKEDYAGGGTFNTEIYRSSLDDSLVGCPAGN